MSISAIRPLPFAAARQARPQALQLPTAKLPDAPNPVTPANAAVHIMKVPSSRVIEAFVSLQRALGQQGQVQVARPPQRVQREMTEPAPPPTIHFEA